MSKTLVYLQGLKCIYMDTCSERHNISILMLYSVGRDKPSYKVGNLASYTSDTDFCQQHLSVHTQFLLPSNTGSKSVFISSWPIPI